MQLLQIFDPSKYKSGYDWFAQNLFEPGVYTLVTFTAFFFLRRLFLKIVFRYHQDSKVRLKWRKTITYTLYLLLSLILLPVWAPPLKDLATFLGIFGAGVVIAFKDILLSLGYWGFIMLRKPFEIGDRVQIGDLCGDVLDIQMFDFTLLEVVSRENGGLSTGRVVRVPNNMLGAHPLANASRDFSFNWNEIQLKLTKESDWQKCENLIMNIASEVLADIKEDDHRLLKAKNSMGIHFRTLKPRVYLDLKNGTPTLTLRHITEPRKTRDLTDDLWRRIIESLANEPSIQLAE